MNKGLEILIARIESNPEEFETNSRWLGLIETYKNILPEEDMKVFNAKLYERACNKFTELVMEELLNPKKENPKSETITLSGGATHGITLSPYQQSHHAQQSYNNLQNQGVQAQNQGLLGSLGNLFR